MVTRDKIKTAGRSEITAREFLRRFGRDESGVMAIFGVYIFIMMLMVVGIGVDLMRFERDRTTLQYTLDRAVLAAADLDQPLSPEAVVNDYFNKAGLSDYLSSVTVEQGLGFRVVTADATKNFKTQFMHMTGVETLVAPAVSTAEERIDNVEISLVLDVSGSMWSNSRLTNLKIAAKDFVDSMFDNSPEGKVSISIIPYATQVSAPQELFDLLNVTDEHNYSRCINFNADDFTHTYLDLEREFERTMHFDPWTYDEGRTVDPKRLVWSPVCEPYAAREMILFENNRSTLKNFIDGFQAGGNTSIDVGMKWGAVLLDPSIRPIVQQLAADGDVPAEFAARPADFDDRGTLKVVVLMTDGENTSQYYLEDDFRRGPSNIWWNDQEEKYSVYVGLDEDDQDNDGVYDEPLFYWPHSNTWEDHAFGEGVFEEERYEYQCTSFRRNGSCRRYRTVVTTVTVDEPGEAEELSYADLYAYTSLGEIVRELYEPWMNDNQAWNDWYHNVQNAIDSGLKNSRSSSICAETREAGIIVFGIGFEAPWNGRQVVRNCSSSPSHYFDVDGLEISDAFASIASSIRQLRLTQ